MKVKTLLKLTDEELDKKVKIQGTIYDRKRVMNHLDIMNAKRMLDSGKKVSEVARHYEVSAKTIRYNTDPWYRMLVLVTASGKHYGTTNHDLEDRVAYKRELVARRAHVIVEE